MLDVILVSDETFLKTFDKVDTNQVKTGELSVAEGCADWCLKKEGSKKYSVGQMNKLALIDLTEVTPKDLNKQLLEDLISVAVKLDSEEMCVAIAGKSPTAASMARSMTIFGFTADSKAECQQFTSNPDIVIMRMEVSQEDDFVDL